MTGRLPPPPPPSSRNKKLVRSRRFNREEEPVDSRTTTTTTSSSEDEGEDAAGAGPQHVYQPHYHPHHQQQQQQQRRLAEKHPLEPLSSPACSSRPPAMSEAAGTSPHAAAVVQSNSTGPSNSHNKWKRASVRAVELQAKCKMMLYIVTC